MLAKIIIIIRNCTAFSTAGSPILDQLISFELKRKKVFYQTSTL